jgi:hypothetical protein
VPITTACSWSSRSSAGDAVAAAFDDDFDMTWDDPALAAACGLTPPASADLALPLLPAVRSHYQQKLPDAARLPMSCMQWGSVEPLTHPSCLAQNSCQMSHAADLPFQTPRAGQHSCPARPAGLSPGGTVLTQPAHHSTCTNAIMDQRKQQPASAAMWAAAQSMVIHASRGPTSHHASRGPTSPQVSPRHGTTDHIAMKAWTILQSGF